MICRFFALCCWFIKYCIQLDTKSFNRIRTHLFLSTFLRKLKSYYYIDLVRRILRAQWSWRYRSCSSSNRVSVSESPVNSLSFTGQTSFHFLRPSAAGALTRLYSHFAIDGEASTLLIRKDPRAISLLFALYAVKFIHLKNINIYIFN